MVKVSSRYDQGDRLPLGVTVDVTEAGDDTDWDETGSPTQHPTQTEDAHDASAVSYDNTSSGLTADDVQEAIDELAEGFSGDFELKIEGGQSTINDHGNLGTTEDVDPSDGNVQYGTLTDDATVTLLQPVGSGAATIELWVTQDGTGGWELTIDSDGGSVSGDISAHTQVAGETFRVIAERVPGTTNDWVVDLVGGGGSVGALDDLSDVTITSVTAADRLRYNGSAWVNSDLHWEPMVLYDGTVMLDSGGNPHMHEVSH